PGGVPLTCPGSATVTNSLTVTYQVRSQDIQPVPPATVPLTAQMNYTAAESCTGTPPSAGVPNGSTSVPNTIQNCPLSTQCRTSVCDPNLMANSGPCATNNDCPGGG